MANKDFFDEEFDKIEQSSVGSHSDEFSTRSRFEDSRGDNGNFDNWSGYQPTKVEQAKSKKPLYIVLLCLALVLCIALGWFLCAIFGSLGSSSKQERLLLDVLDVLKNDYYKQVPQEKLWQAVEAAGTALLQTGGDQFSRLMSPQTYYNYMNPTSSVVSTGNGVFGMSFQFVDGVGLYVSSIVVNSSAYGALREGDIIVKLSQLKNVLGQSVNIQGQIFEEIVPSQWEQNSFTTILANVHSALFHVLRDGEIVQYSLTRSNLQFANPEYPFEFVEFYFGDDCTNVSVTKGNANTCVKDERLLGELSKLKDTGYIRIDQFMDTYNENGVKLQADVEFRQALTLFKSRGLKRLILDLKGNPGGSVDYVSSIAGMLVTDAKLNDKQRQKVTSSDGLLITTLQPRAGSPYVYSRESTYDLYFDAPTDKPDIVVWTDAGSASASELLTGALRDYGTAVQMGTTTYGKGIAQTCIPLSDYTGTVITNLGQKTTGHWAIYFTIAEYFSPVTTTNIHGKGYTPQAEYDNLDTYEKLWDATIKYFNSANVGGGIQAAA